MCRTGEAAAVAAYHAEIVRRLAATLDDRLIGVYAAGSVGLNDFDPVRSDLDVFAVARTPVTHPEKETIVARLRHEALPCPARGLEFVLYPEETARLPSDAAGFLLNLNTGREIDFQADFEPGRVERHWFPLDRAIVRMAGTTLHGPPAAELFAPIPRRLLLPVVREALVWHREPGRSGHDDTVLNACRALRWLREGVWSSKREAADWAFGRVADGELVERALATRRTGADFGRARVEAFVDTVVAELDRELS